MHMYVHTHVPSFVITSGCKLQPLPPPPLPLNYVRCQEILDKIVTRLCIPTTHGKVVAITGVGGFGKTTTVIALCHHPKIQKKFTQGVLFVELGPQATDPYIKLNELYFELVGENARNVNNIEAEIKEVTKSNEQNLLVIIDDIWHTEDAKLIINAFSHCHIVCTTRQNTIAQVFTTAENITEVGPMKLDKAVALLTNKLFDLSKISDEEVKLLEELAQDAHMWPVLLSLIRGQLQHKLKVNSHQAIKDVRETLHNKGLTAFDKSNLESVTSSRMKSVRICIETTLELLSEDVVNKYITLILFTGIGGHFIRSVIHSLWKVPIPEARKVVNTLLEYGLVTLKVAPMLRYLKSQVVCTHSVISQYTIEHIRSDQVANLSPFARLNTDKSVCDELVSLFTDNYDYELQNVLQSSPEQYLNYTIQKLEQVIIPFHLKQITAHMLHDPHIILMLLQRIQTLIYSSENELQIVTQFSEQIVNIDKECKKVTKESQALDRDINSKVKHFLLFKKYAELENTLEKQNMAFSIGSIAESCIKMIEDIAPLCENSLKSSFTYVTQMLIKMTPQCHSINMEKLPIMKLYLNLHKDIANALETKSSVELEKINAYIVSGDFNKELESVSANYLIKLQESAPEVLSSTLAMYNK